MSNLALKQKEMNQVVQDLWPYLVVPIAGVIGWLFRQIFVLKAKVDVLEKSVDSLQTTMKNTIESIDKTIENIQKRQDSHSKKQDEFLEKMNSMEKEVLKQMGTVRADISALASNLQGFSNLILASDNGIKINRQ